MIRYSAKILILCTTLALAPAATLAQSDAATNTAADAAEASALLTPEELQKLVGPIALFPDTLLIQVLVGATFPLDIVKADRLLKDNPGAAPEDLKPKIEAEGWDDSVSVLATAFPEVLTEMAVHVDWTQTVGDAMLAQQDDVMAAVQVMRETALDAGTLSSGEQQTVEVTQEDGDQTVIIQPTDPEVVYVPQYDPNTVYVEENSFDAGDAVATGLIAWGTFALIDAIFDDNDPWYGYWGCRNCGGWGGRPVINNPNVDIDVNGNVNIRDRDNVGWKPDERRQNKARDDLSRRREASGGPGVKVDRPDRGDEMRDSLSRKTGAKDISRDKNARAQVEQARRDGAGAGGARPAAGNRKAASDRKPNGGGNRKEAVARTGGHSGGKAQRPKASRQAAPKQRSRPSGGAMQHRSSAPKARSGGSRGRAAAGGRRR